MTRLVISGSWANGAGIGGSKDIQDGVFAIPSPSGAWRRSFLSELFISDPESLS